jgi:hypothetical protein
MAFGKGLYPRFDNLIEKDSQIVKIDLDYTDIASRPTALPKSIKNQMTIKHVPGKGA